MKNAFVTILLVIFCMNVQVVAENSTKRGKNDKLVLDSAKVKKESKRKNTTIRNNKVKTNWSKLKDLFL